MADPHAAARGTAAPQLPGAYLPTEPLEFSWVHETQRAVGTVVHAWLARLAQLPQLPPSPHSMRSAGGCSRSSGGSGSPRASSPAPWRA